jgi:hypothetical protein
MKRYYDIFKNNCVASFSIARHLANCLSFEQDGSRFPQNCGHMTIDATHK